jgi:uncharacterized damage-inducible protein DinB
MEISNVNTFLAYYENIRSRTKKLVSVIPPAAIDWSYTADKFTLGDLIRHIAATERFMFAENILGKPSTYSGCGTNLADGYYDTIKFLDTMHNQSMEIFRKLTLEDLERYCVTPAGRKIQVWKWLRAMTEHEIHHRGQMYVYLGLLQRKVPSLFGLTSEEVVSGSLGNSVL